MKNMITLFVAIVCCLPFTKACPYIGASQSFTILDRKTSLPLIGTTVTLLLENKPIRYFKTDSSGKFHTYLWENNYMLVVKHDGYVGVNQQLNVGEDRDMTIDVWLSVVKKPKVVVREYERYKRTRIIQINVLENLNKSISSDPLYNTFTCNMQHFNRKDETLMSKNDKLFNDVLVYPNPAESGSPVFVESKFDERKVLIIYDMAGAEIMRSEIVYHGMVETSLLKTGLYILKVVDIQNDDVVTRKLLVQ